MAGNRTVHVCTRIRVTGSNEHDCKANKKSLQEISFCLFS